MVRFGNCNGWIPGAVRARFSPGTASLTGFATPSGPVGSSGTGEFAAVGVAETPLGEGTCGMTTTVVPNCDADPANVGEVLREAGTEWVILVCRSDSGF